MKILKLITIILTGVLISIYSCEKNDGTTKFNLHLTDAPADYDSVFIDIQSVNLHFQANDSDGDWLTLEELNSGIYDLLKFNNGLDTLLSSTDLPAGTISQIRLILGENNSLFMDGEEFKLKTPSAQTSGLKLNVHARLEAGLTYDMWIDFDAARSIVKTGSGKYILKPVIRAYTEATSGAIKGIISPIEAKPYVFLVVDSDTLGSIADSTGYFMLSGIAAGSYSVQFKPEDPYLEKTISDVTVETGMVTDLDTVLIE